MEYCQAYPAESLYGMHSWGDNGNYCSDKERGSLIMIMQPNYNGEAVRDSARHSSSYYYPASRKTNYHFYLNEDIAIRQYCAARLECQRDEMASASDSASSESQSPILDLAEEDEMIESFINMDDNSEVDDTTGDEEKLVMLTDERFPAPIIQDIDVSSRACTEMVKPSTGQVNQGLHLVHLLLACAEAVGCRDSQLAATVLQQIWKSAHPCGDSLQRVACYFTRGLTFRLSLLLQNPNTTEVPAMVQPPDCSDILRVPNRVERAEGFQLLYQCTPYIAFGFMAANEAILQAAKGKKSVHILDMGMLQALQWPGLMRKLASRAEGPPNVRLTGMGTSDIQEWGAALSEEAKTLGIAFEFRGIVEPLSPSLLDPTFLDLRQGETLIINSVLCLHKFVKESRGSLRSVLQAMQRLNPCIVTLVEQDANHNGPFFLGRFLESLHYYSAIFDSLEASLPRSSPQRMKVERFHLAEEIGNIVACEGAERVERHERADQWRRQVGRSGFQGVPLRFMSQARMMLSVYACDGYSLVQDKGCLLLGWKGRPIMLASAWRPHTHFHS
ncbi:hypothetical protein KI387_015063 [Taxus chinensis]|uniref:DELLA protein RGL1 n=1 Tax=Taxus chinensis TaxID=29808 RepID=A0AA38GBT1_TAXCH|nr:hypothetical protein KI387_015063 [Taxus chinensis]